ncbi:Hypothetical protein R9X50_00588700 [Acrodontium crateriforme]|uniref:VASt domain-containing protein n=1 Tax=Acrodontium crateriforme TaxID=150365 RepID=A0AAQ3RDE2_9PEZI|nr:Hypothetical protein R9X50_00588700 [Acrodontium crateriforme]
MSLAEPDSPRKALSRLRGNKAPSNLSSTSINAGSADDDSNESGGPSSSLDGASDKAQTHAKRSIKGRRERAGSNDSARMRLTNLVTGRKKKTEKDEPFGPDYSPKLSNAHDSGLTLSAEGSRSESSLVAGSTRSSLFTEDDSDVHGKPVRPTLSPHDSHAGLLTLSSPELSSQTHTVASANKLVIPSESFETLLSTNSVPQIVEPSETASLPPKSPTKRGSSPAGRLRGSFTLARKKSTGDTESLKSPSGISGLRGVFKSSSRRNSVNPDPVDIPLVQEKIIETSSSENALGVTGEPVEKIEPRPETPKQRGKARINTNSLPGTPRNLVDTPVTVVTPPTPTIASLESGQNFSSPPKPGNRTPNLSSVESIRHRRAQSATLPSRLSNSIPLPLTPTIEETKTPGGTLTQPTVATGFFSSFFSAAQKAADQLSTNINTSIIPGAKAKNGNPAPTGKAVDETTDSGTEIEPHTDGPGIRRRSRTLDTLGKGDLSLNQLGILEDRQHSPMSSTADLLQQDPQGHLEDASKRAEEEAAARAVSVAYEKPVQSVISQATGRPLSIDSNEKLTLGESQTPDRTGTDTDHIKRSSSVRSKLSGRRRKHRASSATQGTSNSIAAAIQSTNTGLANLNAHGTGHRTTGFAVASSKRNKDFHQLFRSVPEDDYLIEDYSAALQRDILLHGRLYVSEGHVCFSSNILGWVTNLVIGFDEIVSVEKKNTAVIFPNAIVISTLHARNTFASFVARDSTYELLIGIWKTNHPNLKSSLNGVTLDDTGTGDKTEVDPDASDIDSADGTDDEVYDEDDDDDVGSFTDAGITASIAGSDVGDGLLSRKTSAAPLSNTSQPNGTAMKSIDGPETTTPNGANSGDSPGPATHPPTECADGAEHYDRPLTDTIIPAPLGKVYSLMFGPTSGAFMRRWLAEDMKQREVNYPDDKTGLDNDHRTFTFDYIKPLSAPVGPKQTKCITTNTLLAFDLEKAVSIDCSTQTPDVPSGNVFTTKTRYCLMWGPENSTRMIASCTIEWTGKSWLKGPIEKGANDGQIDYVKNIVAALRASVTAKAVAKGAARKGRRKGKKEVLNFNNAAIQGQSAKVAERETPDWGIFEIVRPLLDPIFGLLRPFMTLQVFTAVLFALLMYTWALPPSGGGVSIGVPGYSTPERLAAYEEIWRREESELWDWLEDRVGLDGVYSPNMGNEGMLRQKVLGVRNMGKKLEDERMSERQMDEAIRVTEERLATLKDAVKRKSGPKNSL